MEIVWEPCFIIQAWFIQFLLFRSDVDLADVTGRLTVMCRGLLLFISSRFIYRGIIDYISGERRIKSCPLDILTAIKLPRYLKD